MRRGRVRRSVTTPTSRRGLWRYLDEAPRKGFAPWNRTVLAQALKDVSSRRIWMALREHSILPERRHNWCTSAEPQFADRAADVVVLCVDEKPSLQARRTVVAAPQWQSAQRLLALLQARWRNYLIGRHGSGYRRGQDGHCQWGRRREFTKRSLARWKRVQRLSIV
jgi:hypothetical protein